MNNVDLVLNMLEAGLIEDGNWEDLLLELDALDQELAERQTEALCEAWFPTQEEMDMLEGF